MYHHNLIRLNNNWCYSQEKNTVAKKKYDYVFAPPLLPPLLTANITQQQQDTNINTPRVQNNTNNGKNNFGTQTFTVD